MPKSTILEMSPEEASPDAGRAAACTLRLSAGPAYPAFMRGGTQPHRDCRRAVLLALQCVPHGASVSGRHPGPGARRGGSAQPPSRTTVLVPTLRRSLVALLKAAPRAYGWCRTRWSCATLAATLQTTRGITVSAETLRRWVHEVGWVWKRAKLVAKDDDPQRVHRLARIRLVCEQLKRV